ncbi:MAG: homoserine dehydrogenase [Oscillospiraceae bacterium]
MKHIAIAGLGVVGGGVAEILLKNAALLEKNAGEKIVLKAIYTRTPKKDGPFAPYFVSDFSAIEQDPEIDLVVETIGGSTVALDFVSRALKAGKHVVTANKQLIAEHGLELFALAKANGVNILFEASVAGGIPVLNPLTRCLGANEITEVSGILNGTTNYILTQMLENGESYADALSNAQRLGYAEADPTADVEGIDAARKSCILSGLAFGKNVSPEDIHVEGISKVDALDAAFAESGGMKIKLLGRTLLQNGKRFCFVSPHFIKASALLAGVNGVFNAVCVRASEVGEVLFAGPGAGRYPTASAVVGDIIDRKIRVVCSLPAGTPATRRPQASRSSTRGSMSAFRRRTGRRWSSSSAKSAGFRRARALSPASPRPLRQGRFCPAVYSPHPHGPFLNKLQEGKHGTYCTEIRRKLGCKRRAHLPRGKNHHGRLRKGQRNVRGAVCAGRHHGRSDCQGGGD